MPGSELRLLALDGGGVRGLSALMILEQLMEAVDPDAPPKPCDYFDMIGGTSTGGLIAVMLGRLRMSVADCIAAYLKLSERVFRKTRHRVTVKGRIQGRFDSDELARAIREAVKQQGLPEDALLKDEPGTMCKVFVCATSKETSETVCLTSYRTPRGNSDLLNSVTIWEACRATSAASSFFDPIAVGQFGEEFVDGATGANNPVREVWDQAQVMWGPEPLEGKVKCLVSIGMGVPSLKAFKDDVLHIGPTLVALTTETEQTAERFQRERPALDSTGRYYRFNVNRGLEDIGLEEAKKVKEMTAATRRYIGTQAVLKQMQACAGSIAGRAYYGEYQVAFSLEGVPRVRQFVDRPAEMAKLEQALLPGRKSDSRQSIHVLHGLGGIGKTQLAVEFARRHYRRFSVVLWLDGRSEDSLKRSIASCAGRIPQGQIPEASRGYATDSGADVDAVVKDVIGWLARPDNSAWLLIFDNVDREYNKNNADTYDVRRYFSVADHGYVLITTRLARLKQLGESQELGKVDKIQARAIIEVWCKQAYDAAWGERLLRRLDGLPLAIAQAGAYLEESEISVKAYLLLYDQQWNELMAMDDEDGALLQDYPDRNVWTTWVISYLAIREKHEATANLLLLWSYFGNKDLCHELFATACQASETACTMLFETIGDIANSRVKFYDTMRRLRNFSLAESIQETGSYAIHLMVHKWAFYYRGKQHANELYRLAVVIVGIAIPEDMSYFSSALGRRLLPHVQSCNRCMVKAEQNWALRYNSAYENIPRENEKKLAFLKALYLMGLLYKNQSKSLEAKQMYEQALRGQEKLLGPTHESTLMTFNDLAVLNQEQGELAEAEYMYDRARRGREERFGPDHHSTLQTANNLATFYADQGKLADAQRMFEQVLLRKERALGLNDISTLNTNKNLGAICARQGKLEKAQQQFERALQGFERYLGKERARYYLPALDTLENLGDINEEQGKHYTACAMYLRAFYGLRGHLDHSSCRWKQLVDKFVRAAGQHIRKQGHISSSGV